MEMPNLSWGHLKGRLMGNKPTLGELDRDVSERLLTLSALPTESQYSSTPFFRVETDEALQSSDKPAVFEMQHMPPGEAIAHLEAAHHQGRTDASLTAFLSEPANAHVPVRKPFFDRTGLALGGAATTVVGGGLGVLWWDYFAQKKLRRQCRRDRTPKKCARFQRG